MRALGLAAASASLAGAALAGPALATPTLKIEHAVVSVVVVPENRPDILVQVYRPNASLPLTVTRQGDEVVIDGGLPGFLTSCHGSGGALRALVLFRGDYGVSDFPQVRVAVPMSAAIESGGIVHGAVARSQNLTLRHGGCGDWTVANVAGRLQAQVSGVGAVRTGTAGSADLSLSGAGRLAAGAVAGEVTARLSGTGALTVLSAGAADLDMSGSGALKTGPVAGALRADLSGAGSLEVASVAGPLSADVSGVGGVHVRGGHATLVDARVSGAGHVAFDGVADSLHADVSGVGDVDVAKVTGAIDQHVSGVGAVHVGGR